jgi:hypothetical protein
MHSMHKRPLRIVAHVVGGLAGAAALALAACGGGSEASTVTVTAPPPPQAQRETPPPAQAPTEGTLPEGVLATDGTYIMRLRDADTNSGASNNLVDKNANMFSDDETLWRFSSRCAGGRCTVQMRRELPNGAGFKEVTLEPAENRPGVFEGNSTGTYVNDGRECQTQQRYSIRLYEPTDVGGRPTATRMDAYYKARTGEDCFGDPVSGGLTWTGARTG